MNQCKLELWSKNKLVGQWETFVDEVVNKNRVIFKGIGNNGWAKKGKVKKRPTLTHNKPFKNEELNPNLTLLALRYLI